MTDISLLNDYFDHIYVLTLKRAKDRHLYIEKVLAGLDWDFFYGIDKRSLDYEKVIRDGLYDDSTHRKTKRTSRSMALGEVACALSHKAIYQDILDSGYQKVLILEDDVLPLYEKLRTFKEVIKELPKDWEVLMLGYEGEKLPTLKYKLQIKIYCLYHYLYLFKWQNVSKQWIKEICLSPYSDHLYSQGKVMGAYAYAMTSSAAKKFIQYQTPIILQADRIFNYYKAARGLRYFIARQRLFIPGEVGNRSYNFGE